MHTFLVPAVVTVAVDTHDTATAAAPVQEAIGRLIEIVPGVADESGSFTIRWVTLNGAPRLEEIDGDPVETCDGCGTLLEGDTGWDGMCGSCADHPQDHAPFRVLDVVLKASEILGVGWYAEWEGDWGVDGVLCHATTGQTYLVAVNTHGELYVLPKDGHFIHIEATPDEGLDAVSAEVVRAVRSHTDREADAI